MSVPASSSTAGDPSPAGKSGLGKAIDRVRPFMWVPSLYLAMGIPYNAIVGGTAARMYKSLGYTDSQITVPLGFIGLAWSLKPFWAAFLDMYRTKKFFVLSMELLLAILMAGVALSLPLPGFYTISLAILCIAAFASSTQDICADGIYLTALNKADQAKYAGIQGMFWTLGKVVATGVVVWLLDLIRQSQGWSYQHMWGAVFGVIAVLMVGLFVYHVAFLPSGSIEARPANARAVVGDFFHTAGTFFHKRAFWGMIAFVFLYRMGEGLILIEGQLFLQSSTAQGGLGLTAGEVSSIDSIWGTIAFVVGTTLGGLFVGRMGLKSCLWILGLALNIPHLTFVILSQLAGDHHGLGYWTIVSLVSIEKFGYGFGFVGNMIYMMQQIAPGRSTMTHYAFATALMQLMLVPTNMVSGPLADWLGFETYFIVVMFASIPSVWAAFKAPFPREEDGPDDGVTHVTADDPSRLSAALQQVQRLAGQASMYAMLHIIVLLTFDAWALGTLQGAERASGGSQFYWLCLFAAGKLVLTWIGWKKAGEALAAGAAIGDKAYTGNARGARITLVLCVLATIAVLAFGAYATR